MEPIPCRNFEFIASVVLRGWEVHEIHGNNRPRPLCDWEGFGKSLASRWRGLVDLTVVTSAYAVDNIGDDGLPVEVTICRRESLLVTEMPEGLVNMIDQDVPQPFLSAVHWNLDIGDAETNAAGGAVLIQETGVWVQVVDRVRVRDGKSFGEQWVRFIAVPNGICIFIDSDGEKTSRVRHGRLVQDFR